MSDLKQTDLSKRLREIATAFESSGDYHKTMNAAADEIERYYTGMLNWKATAEAKDADFRKTYRKPEATAPAQDLSAAILALPCKMPDYRDYAMGSSERGPHRDGYRAGHRAALKAAAALASSANALSAGDRVDAERWRAFLGSQRIRPLGSAGLERPEPNNYAHMGLEIWTTYGWDYSPKLLEQMDSDNEKGRRWLTKYADVARAAILQSQKDNKV